MVEGSFVKDPDAVLDFAFNWRRDGWLEEMETIHSYTITVQSGITEDSALEAGGTVQVWLSGGTAGESYLVSCRITTSLGRIDERSVQIQCQER